MYRRFSRGRFFGFSDDTEELSDHNESESEDDAGEDESVSSSNFEDSDAESDSNGMCFACLFVLATDFTTFLALLGFSMLFCSIDINILH